MEEARRRAGSWGRVAHGSQDSLRARSAALPRARPAHRHDRGQRLLRHQRGDVRVAGVVQELKRAPDGPRGRVAHVGVGVLHGLAGGGVGARGRG